MGVAGGLEARLVLGRFVSWLWRPPPGLSGARGGMGAAPCVRDEAITFFFLDNMDFFFFIFFISLAVLGDFLARA